MKILYTTDQLRLHGGIEKILTSKINHWIADYKYRVALCTTEQKGQPFTYKISDKVQHFDLNINYSRQKSYFHPLNLAKTVLHFNRFQNLIKKFRPDVIVSVNYTPEQFFLPCFNRQIPTVKELHSSGYISGNPQGFLKGRLFRLFGRYTRLVVLNPDEKQHYPFNNLEVIPNFVERPKFCPPEPKEKTILAAGRIAPVKQFDHLITAWSKIAHKFPDWNVKIFGDGDPDLRNSLESMIQKLQAPRVDLMGATDKLEEEMSKATVYALTSRTECFPMVLLEALGNGMAIVSYDCPYGPRNIIEHEHSGLLVENQNIEAFSRQLEALLSDPSTIASLGKNSLQRAQAFTPHQIMASWNKLLLEIVNQ